MARYWYIREQYGDKKMSSKETEAYECGFEEGYEAAMKDFGIDPEMEEMSDSRMRSGSMGARGRYGMRYGEGSERSGKPNSYVEGEDRESLGYRRGRDSMGRFR